MKRNINLFDARFRPKKDLFSGHGILNIIVVVVTTLGLLSGLMAWMGRNGKADLIALKVEERRARDQVDQLEKKFPVPKRNRRLEKRVKELARTLNERKGALAVLEGRSLGNRNGLGHYLEQLGHGRVVGVWLNEVVVNKGGKKISLSGQTLDKRFVPMFLKSLKEKQAYHGSRFRIFRIEDDGDSDYLRFSVKTDEMGKTALDKAMEALGK
ncbi:MAG: hypothetical protein HQL54_04650 [Magnetococcales bacterium]|nr:hypothetical protein [Magnetococcales bacterium]